MSFFCPGTLDYTYLSYFFTVLLVVSLSLVFLICDDLDGFM